MTDHLAKKTAKIKRFSESVKRRASLYSDLTKIGDKKTAQSLRALVKAPDPGRKITKIGFIIFWFPEPTFISHAIGGPMILAGKYLERVYNGATISDIGHETKNMVTTIKDFKEATF
jgi:hypothetical protein